MEEHPGGTIYDCGMISARQRDHSERDGCLYGPDARTSGGAAQNTDLLRLQNALAVCLKLILNLLRVYVNLKSTTKCQPKSWELKRNFNKDKIFIKLVHSVKGINTVKMLYYY